MKSIRCFECLHWLSSGQRLFLWFWESRSHTRRPKECEMWGVCRVVTQEKKTYCYRTCNKAIKREV